MADTTTRREHAGAAAPATLTAVMNPGDLSFALSTNVGWPTGSVGQFFVVLDPGRGTEEKVLCSSQSSGTVVVISGGRGQDGTSAATHQIGAVAYPVWTALEADEANAHSSVAVHVHGVAGSVVGTTDAQVLSNKTIADTANTITVGGTAIGTAMAAKQPLDAGLTALAAYNTNGLLAQTAVDTFAGRTITPANSMVTVTNGSGALGNPTVGVTPANFTGMVATGIGNVNGGANLGADVSTLKTRVDAIETVPVTLIFTANGTISSAQAANAKAIRLRGCNGGASSGGCATTIASQSAHSGPGAGGASAEGVITTAGLTYPLQVNVGGGGAAPAAGANNGNIGGQSSVKDNNGAGATLWTPGVQNANQKGLAGAAAATIGDAAVPGFDGATTGGVGDFVVPGQGANVPTRVAAAVCVRCYGGNSLYGAGGTPGNATAGGAGQGYGSGGGGSYLGASTTQVVGAAGAGGIVIAEFIY